MSNYGVEVDAGSGRTECLHRLTLRFDRPQDVQLEITSVCNYVLMDRMRDLALVDRISGGNRNDSGELEDMDDLQRLHPYAKKWVTTVVLASGGASLLKSAVGPEREGDLGKARLLAARLSAVLMDGMSMAASSKTSAEIIRTICKISRRNECTQVIPLGLYKEQYMLFVDERRDF